MSDPAFVVGKTGRSTLPSITCLSTLNKARARFRTKLGQCCWPSCTRQPSFHFRLKKLLYISRRCLVGAASHDLGVCSGVHDRSVLNLGLVAAQNAFPRQFSVQTQSTSMVRTGCFETRVRCARGSISQKNSLFPTLKFHSLGDLHDGSVTIW